MAKYKATAYIRLSYTDDRSSESDSVPTSASSLRILLSATPTLRLYPTKLTMATAVSSLTAPPLRK